MFIFFTFFNSILFFSYNGFCNFAIFLEKNIFELLQVFMVHITLNIVFIDFYIGGNIGKILKFSELLFFMGYFYYVFFKQIYRVLLKCFSFYYLLSLQFFRTSVHQIFSLNNGFVCILKCTLFVLKIVYKTVKFS